MRSLFFILFALAMQQAWGQSPCDGVQIGDIRYDAFRDSVLLVEVANNSGDIFSYPGFILYDAGGDTIAMETVNFFGIGGEQIHSLTLHAGAGAPTEVLDGSLELWMLFYDSLACTFPVSEPLCPDTVCSNIVLNLGNLGGALINADYTFTLKNGLGNTLYTAAFTLADTVQFFEDTVCLPIGDYSLEIYTADNPTGGQPHYLVYEPASQFWGSALTGPVSQAMPSMTVPFTLFPNCPSGPNAVKETDPEASVKVFSGPEGVWAVSKKGEIMEMRLYDLTGRLLSRKTGPGESIFLPSSGWSGLFLVQVLLEQEDWIAEIVFVE